MQHITYINYMHSSVAFEGRIAVIGFASGKIPKIPANLLLVKSCSAVGVYWGSYSQRYPEKFQVIVTLCAIILDNYFLWGLN